MSDIDWWRHESRPRADHYPVGARVLFCMWFEASTRLAGAPLELAAAVLIIAERPARRGNTARIRTAAGSGKNILRGPA